MWTPDAAAYAAQGSFVYSGPFQTGPVNGPKPVQIWNQHAGINFNSSAWLAYGSNALEIWFIPADMEPGDVMPPDYANGRIPSGTLVFAPEGIWPALYRDAADETRLHNAVLKYLPPQGGRRRRWPSTGPRRWATYITSGSGEWTRLRPL